MEQEIVQQNEASGSGVATAAPQTEKKKKGGIFLKVLLILLLLVIIFGIGVLIALQLMPKEKSQFEIDADALAGFVSTRTEAEVQAELDRVIDESRFNISINPMITVESDGTADVMVENVPANHYLMQVTINCYYPDGTIEPIYESGLIPPGYCIETADITGNIPPQGDYDAIAEFKALHQETQEEIGSTAATIVVSVKG